MEGTDDYASMQEVIGRRLARYEQEKDTGRGFGRLPDLILLDGGQGHLNAVQPILEAFGLKIPMYGMVKDDRHRTRAIASDGGEISISAHKRAFNLVTAIQDEVHRFSITYSRFQAPQERSGIGSHRNPRHRQDPCGGAVPAFQDSEGHLCRQRGGSAGGSGYDPSRRGSGVWVFPSGGKCSGVNVGRVRHGY